jgi:hypothetical protein
MMGRNVPLRYRVSPEFRTCPVTLDAAMRYFYSDSSSIQSKVLMTHRKALACSMFAAAMIAGATASGCASAGSTSTSASAAARNVADGPGVIAAMHDRYANTWYRTLRFRQNVVTTRAGKETPGAVWLEHAIVPGYLRIDQAHDYNGSGVIYGPDSVYVFRDGKNTTRRKERNPLMVLGFDVYRQPVARTMAVLQEDGYDMTKFHTDTWQGKEVYVIGADAGDTHTKQFWVEKDRLLFVRALAPTGRDGAQTIEYQFNDYQPLAGGWIAVKCNFLRDGVEFQREEYFDIVGNPKLPDGIMDPAQWGTVKLEK